MKRIGALVIAVTSLAIGPLAPASADPAVIYITGTMQLGTLPFPGASGLAGWSIASSSPSVGELSASGTVTGSCLDATGSGYADVQFTPPNSPTIFHSGAVTWSSSDRIITLRGVWGTHVFVAVIHIRFDPCFPNSGPYYDYVGVGSVTGV